MDRQLKDLIQSDVKRYYSGGGYSDCVETPESEFRTHNHL